MSSIAVIGLMFDGVLMPAETQGVMALANPIAVSNFEEFIRRIKREGYKPEIYLYTERLAPAYSKPQEFQELLPDCAFPHIIKKVLHKKPMTASWMHQFRDIISDPANGYTKSSFAVIRSRLDNSGDVPDEFSSNMCTLPIGTMFSVDDISSLINIVLKSDRVFRVMEFPRKEHHEGAELIADINTDLACLNGIVAQLCMVGRHLDLKTELEKSRDKQLYTESIAAFEMFTTEANDKITKVKQMFKSRYEAEIKRIKETRGFNDIK